MPKGELSTKGIVHDAFREGKKVYVPYIHPCDSKSSDKPRSAMSMVSLHSLSDYESLSPNDWGIPSVSSSSIGERHQVLNPQSEGFSDSKTDGSTEGKGTEKLDVIVMPGVAFDKDLRRLGHGKGFYDNFLNHYNSPKADSKPFLGRSAALVHRSVSDVLLVGLSLDVQLLPEGQSAPTDASDHNLDALVVGDGTVIRPK